MDFDDEYELPIKHIAAKPAALDKLAAAWTIDFRPAAAALADDKRHRLAKITPMLHDASPAQLSKLSADKFQAAKSCWLSSAMVDGQWHSGVTTVLKNMLSSLLSM